MLPAQRVSRLCSALHLSCEAGADEEVSSGFACLWSWTLVRTAALHLILGAKSFASYFSGRLWGSQQCSCWSVAPLPRPFHALYVHMQICRA